MNSNRILYLSTIIFGILTLGCGGDSAGGSSTGSVSLHLSTASPTYGQPVTVSWTSSNLASIDGASFPVNSNDITGSFADKPATSTTYQITGRTLSNDVVSSTITVNLQKGSKKILFLADTAQSSTNSLTDFLQGLSTQPVQVSLTLPSVFSADVIVISSSAAVSPSDVAAIKSFLNAGGGLVLIRWSTRLLATGDINNENISAIGNFFAGVTLSSSSDLGSNIVSGSPGTYPLGVSLFGQPIDAWGVRPVSASATLLTTEDQFSCTSGFAYSPATGGRVAYAGSAAIDSSAQSTSVRNMFLGEVRWASKE